MTPLPKDPLKADAIVRAAIRVFARDGLDKGKIADVAKEAGIGKGTVYEYFSSKDEIFHAIETTLMGDMVDASKKLLSMNLSPPEKLRTLIRMNTELIFEMEDTMLILLEIWAQGARAIMKRQHGTTGLFDIYEIMRNMVIQVLNEGTESGHFRTMNPEGVATLLLAFIDGFIWQFMLVGDRDLFDRALHDGIESFMKGLEP